MIIVCDTLTGDKGTIFFRHTQDFTRMETTQKLRTVLQYWMDICLPCDGHFYLGQPFLGGHILAFSP